MANRKKIKIDAGTFNIERYETATEVVALCKTRGRTSGRFSDMPNYDIKKSWHGVESYREALELMENGYAASVEGMKGKIKTNLAGQGKRVTFNRDVAGFAPIVPLALQGVPNSMIASKQRPIKTKVLDVYYDMTANTSVSPEQILESGAKVLGAIMELEAQGYRVNLYATQNYHYDKAADMLCVKVKDAKQPIDLKRISFPLTHPAFFRVIGFDWYSKVPDGEYRMGYGRSIAYSVEENELIKIGKDLFGKNAVLFSCAKTIKQDMEHIKAVMKGGEK